MTMGEIVERYTTSRWRYDSSGVNVSKDFFCVSRSCTHQIFFFFAHIESILD